MNRRLISQSAISSLTRHVLLRADSLARPGSSGVICVAIPALTRLHSSAGMPNPFQCGPMLGFQPTCMHLMVLNQQES